MVSRLMAVPTTISTTMDLEKSVSAFDPFSFEEDEDPAQTQQPRSEEPWDPFQTSSKDNHNRTAAKKSLDENLRDFEAMLEGDTPWQNFGGSNNHHKDDDDGSLELSSDLLGTNNEDGVDSFLRSNPKLGDEDVFGESLADVDLWESSSPQPLRRGRKPHRRSAMPQQTPTAAAAPPRKTRSSPGTITQMARSAATPRERQRGSTPQPPPPPPSDTLDKRGRPGRSRSPGRFSPTRRRRTGSPSPKRRDRSLSKDRSPVKPVRKAPAGHRSKSRDKKERHRRKHRSKSRDPTDEPRHRKRSKSRDAGDTTRDRSPTKPRRSGDHRSKTHPQRRPVKRSQSAKTDPGGERQQPPRRTLSAKAAPQQQQLHLANSGLLRRAPLRSQSSSAEPTSIEPEDLWAAVLRDKREQASASNESPSASRSGHAQRSYLNNKLYRGTANHHQRTGKGDRKGSVESSLSKFLEQTDAWDAEGWGDAFGDAGEGADDDFPFFPDRKGGGRSGQTVASAPVTGTSPTVPKPRNKKSRPRKNRLVPNDPHPPRQRRTTTIGLDAHMRRTRRNGEPGEERSVVSAPAATAQRCHKMHLEF